MKSNKMVASLNQIKMPEGRRAAMRENIVHAQQQVIRQRAVSDRAKTKKNAWKYCLSFAAITVTFIVLLFAALPDVKKNDKGPDMPAAIPAVQPTTSISNTPEANPTVTELTQLPSVTHVMKTIEGESVKLTIDLDVTEYPGREFGVYDASPIQVDHDSWYAYFFSGIDRSELTNFYANWGKQYLELQGITDDYIQNTFAYLYGDTHDPDIEAYYLANQAFFRCSWGITNTSLTDECSLAVDETDRKKAEALSDGIMGFAVGDRLVRTSCDIAKPTDYKGAAYVSLYSRTIEDLPILLDRPIISADLPDPIRMDQGEVWVMNDEVVYASAIVRDLKLLEQLPVIPVNQALGILELHADSVEAYSKDFIDGINDKCEFVIKRIELMYYPVTIEDEELASTYAGKHAYATYRPVWYVASGQRVSTNFEYVMIIDAISGEIIG